MAETITIPIADDHGVVREGVRAYWETQPDLVVVGHVESGERAVRLVGELVPDVVLMDLAMPGIGGIEAIRPVRQVSPCTQVVALTSYRDDEYVFPALRAGGALAPADYN